MEASREILRYLEDLKGVHTGTISELSPTIGIDGEM